MIDTRFKIKFLNIGFDLVGDCHVFRGTPNSKGRVVFNLILPGNTLHSTINASRAAWLLFVGPIPDGLQVLHKCKNQGNCVNINHLYLGTPKDNVQDCINDGNHGMLKRKYCKNGHEWTAENTRYRPKSGRDCRKCDRIRGKKTYLRNKDKYNPIKNKRRREKYAQEKSRKTHQEGTDHLQ